MTRLAQNSGRINDDGAPGNSKDGGGTDPEGDSQAHGRSRGSGERDRDDAPLPGRSGADVELTKCIWGADADLPEVSRREQFAYDA
jgi:hypothetical protein